jgi:hypothetical protein
VSLSQRGVLRRVIGRARYQPPYRTIGSYITEVLECGHKGRSDSTIERDCHETARAMARAAHILNGTSPKRRCACCRDGSPPHFDLATVELMPWNDTDDRATRAVQSATKEPRT